MYWSILILSYLGLFSMGFIENTRGPAYPLILAQYGISASLGSWFFSIASIGGMISTLTHKIWLSHLGPFYSMRYFILSMTIGCLGLGHFSDSSFSYLLFFSFLFGISCGGFGICMNLLTPNSVPLHLRRRAFAGLHSTYALSSLIAPLVLAYFLKNNYSWNFVFEYFFLLPFILFLWTFIITPPKRGPAVLKTSFINKKKILFGLALGLYVAAEVLASSRLVLYCTTQLGWTTIYSSSYLSYFFLFLLIGRVSFASFNFKRSNLFLLITSLLTSSVFFMIGLYIHPIGLSITGLTMSFFFPCYMDWISHLFPEEKEDITSSVLMIMGVMIALTHNLAGKLNENFGIQVAMLTAPIFCMLSLILILKIRRDFQEA